MPNYRYSPKNLMVRPDWFGRRLDASWEPVGDSVEARARLAAAYLQHQAACAARRIADDYRLSVTELANRLGAKPDTLRRKLYGESPARLEDVLSWTLLLGIDVLPEPSGRKDLLP